MSHSRLLSLSSLAAAALGLVTVGCDTGFNFETDKEVELIEGIGPHNPESKIYGGDAPDEAYHDAVVALHNRTNSGSVYTSPFCTGTLITDEWVLTAAHCVETWGGGVINANSVAVYVGDNPFADLSSHVYTVSQVIQHGSYNSSSLSNDIALIQLSSGITEAVTPVEPLPSASGLTSSDVGINLNFAGFGYTETGSYGRKQQVDLALNQVWSSQIYYLQNGGSGPCSGDSGGPAFVDRGSTTYVAGITSYGDASCNRYGVSTKVDAYESWIGTYVTFGGGDTDTDTEPPVDTGEPPVDTGEPPAADCSGFDDTWTGSLSGTGDEAYEPNGTYYSTTRRGAHEAELSGPSGTDFDLYLYQWRRGAWNQVASSTSSSSNESINHTGRRGDYLYVVYSYSGSGDYTLCTSTP